MSHYSITRSYRSGSLSDGIYSRSSFSTWRSPGGYSTSTFRRSYYSSGGFGSSYRPIYKPGKPKPDYDSTWWKYRHYAVDDDDVTRDKTEAKSIIQELDFLLDVNRKAHNTNEYGVKDLIVRRGQEFSLDIELTISFVKGNDTLQLLLSKGRKPQESKGTLVRVDICVDETTAKNEMKGNWLGYISSINGLSASGSKVTVTIKPPADALVGKYTVKTKFFKEEENGVKKRYIRDEDECLYVLFNPWCKDDQVYMENAAERDEYVMKETGRIWVGNARQNNGRPWNFGQFSKHCLKAAIHLLDINPYLNDQGHGNVTLVCRALSAMANSSDNDKGVLQGNWSGKYHGGKAPTSWNGSQAILEEYMLTERTVKFGQCWVFSGLLTTLGRTLGIPTRSVTNFESAHDHDFSLTIDNHYYLQTCAPEKKIEDSIWNFHVWNESWFQRPDLPQGYDGWQAFDATPQEASEGIFRCGPAPVQAIKEGNVYLNYDARFIFAEVNGDRVDWIVEQGGDMYITSLDAHAVGKSISTKKPGSKDQREDVTEAYKYPEGSEEERESVARASQYSSRASKLQGHYAQTTNDVIFSYNSDVQPNGDINLSIGTENKSDEQRHIMLRITANATYYTGISGDELGTEVIDIDLKPSEKTEKVWSLKAQSYLNLIDEDAKVKLYVMAKSEETRQVFTKSEVFNIEKPELQFEMSNSKPKVGESFEVQIKVTNPVDVPLTGGIISLEGPGIQKNLTIHLHRTINSGEQHVEKVKLTGKYAGTREIIACFNSRQLSDVVGSTEIEILE